jgi:hypothetical protein
MRDCSDHRACDHRFHAITVGLPDDGHDEAGASDLARLALELINQREKRSVSVVPRTGTTFSAVL